MDPVKHLKRNFCIGDWTLCGLPWVPFGRGGDRICKRCERIKGLGHDG